MKKFILTLAAIAAVTFSASAQENFYVGGTVGLGVNSGGGNTTVGFILEPEGGWYFNEKMAVGVKLAFEDTGWDTENHFIFGFTPYYRWAFAQVGNVEFFGDAGFTLGSHTQSWKSAGSGSYTDTGFRWGIGVTPGIMINAIGNFKVVVNLLTLGYSRTSFSSGSVFTSSSAVAFGLNFITQGPSVGIEYKF